MTRERLARDLAESISYRFQVLRLGIGLMNQARVATLEEIEVAILEQLKGKCTADLKSVGISAEG